VKSNDIKGSVSSKSYPKFEYLKQFIVFKIKHLKFSIYGINEIM